MSSRACLPPLGTTSRLSNLGFATADEGGLGVYSRVCAPSPVPCGTWRVSRDVPRAGLGWWHLPPTPLGCLLYLPVSGIGDTSRTSQKRAQLLCPCVSPSCPLRVPCMSPACPCPQRPPAMLGPRDGLGCRAQKSGSGLALGLGSGSVSGALTGAVLWRRAAALDEPGLPGLCGTTAFSPWCPQGPPSRV